MQYSSDELNEIFDKLPEALKDAIVSVDNARIIGEIGKKYNLHIDQTGEVAEEVGLVLLGLTHPTEFVSQLTKKVGIDRVVASQIASDINDRIFLKVRELLKSLQVAKPTEFPAEPETEFVRSRSQGGFAPNPVSGPPVHPTRDALLEAIENPDGLSKRLKPTPPGTGLDANPPYDREQERSVPGGPVMPKPTDILEQKLSGQFSMPTVESEITLDQLQPAKKTDMYREQVN